MARRPKKINLEAISDSTNPHHKKHCESLILDLLRKHPRGPECKLTSEDYDDHYSGHPRLHGHGGEDAYAGYEDLLLYRFCVAMSVDGSEWDWKYKMQTVFPHVGKGGITRRSRRMAQRTESAYRRIMRAGRPGIYSVVFGHGYGSRQGKVNVFAENTDMAKLVAKTSFGCTYGDDSCTATFEREGCPSELMGLNMSATATYERQAQAAKEEIKKAERLIELLELRSAMIKTYSIAAVAS